MQPYFFSGDKREFYPSRAVACIIKFKFKTSGRNMMLKRLRDKGILRGDNIPTEKYKHLFKISYKWVDGLNDDCGAVYFTKEAIKLTCDVCADMIKPEFDFETELNKSDEVAKNKKAEINYYLSSPFLKPINPNEVPDENKGPKINLIDFI
jgi:hypothetical protein